MNETNDRTDDDKKLDASRHPAELIAFLGVTPGAKVAELAVSDGYTTELLAREVGPKGKVWAQNPRFVNERFAEGPWSARLKRPAMHNVVRVDRELEDPFPPDAAELDAVLMYLFYHDTFWMKTDRARMNAAVHGALKKGGVYVVIDHSARAGKGSTEVDSLHRIEERMVREEIEKAGFAYVGDADFLRNPSDTRDWNASPRAAGERRGTSDRFALKFQKR
jgi:predicted methyltransferase